MQRVAVIGAGPAGLASLKTALEHGFIVKAFEREESIGGLWRYKQPSNPSMGYYDTTNEDGFAYPVYASLKANTANFNTCFSDFLPNTIHGHLKHYQILDYLNHYSKHFCLEKNIQFNSKVKKLDKDKTNWIITYEKNNAIHRETFDKVLIATGAFRYPNVPTFANEESFSGLCINGSQVRDEKALFANKRVLFIGGGYTGSELAYLALQSNASHVSVIPTANYPRDKVWLWDRCTPNLCNKYAGKPLLEWDYQATYENSVESNGYQELLKTWLMTIDGEQTPEMPDFSNTPHGITESNLFFNDKLNKQKLTVYKSPVISFSRTGVTLRDGKDISPLDIIVKTTGYKYRFPFLDHIYSPEKQEESEMYYNMLPTDRQLDGLAFVLIQRGLIVIPNSEIQARWLCQKFLPKPYISEDGKLFSDVERRQMSRHLEKRREHLKEGASFSYVKYPAKYMNTLATEIGCTPPDHDKLLKSSDQNDVGMGVALYHGPFIGARYRIRANTSSSKMWQNYVDFARNILGNSFDKLVNSYKNANDKAATENKKK